MSVGDDRADVGAGALLTIYYTQASFKLWLNAQLAQAAAVRRNIFTRQKPLPRLTICYTQASLEFWLYAQLA